MLPNESLIDVLSFVDGVSLSDVLASNSTFYHLVGRNRDKLPCVHRMQATVGDGSATVQCDRDCYQRRTWLGAGQHLDMSVHVVTNIIVPRADGDLWLAFHRIPALAFAHCMEVSTDRGAHLHGVFAQLKNLRHLRVNFSSDATWPDLTFLSENNALGVRRLELYFASGVDEFPPREFFRFMFDFSRLPVGSKAKKVVVEFGDDKTAFTTPFVSDILEKLKELEGNLTAELPLLEPDVVASLFYAGDDVKYKKNDHAFAAQRSNVAIMFGRYATITNDMQTANTFFSLVKQKNSMF